MNHRQHPTSYTRQDRDKPEQVTFLNAVHRQHPTRYTRQDRDKPEQVTFLNTVSLNHFLTLSHHFAPMRKQDCI